MTKEELVVLIKKNPISFGCAALSVALIAALYFRGGEIPAAEAELVQKTAEAERFALNVKNADKLKEQLDALVAANKTIEARMVRGRDQGLNTQYFYKLQNDAGVSRVAFSQGATGAVAKGSKATYVPVSFAVSVQGNLTQVLDFLRMLENGTHFCRVLTATCGVSGTNRSAPLTLALNLELLGLP